MLRHKWLMVIAAVWVAVAGTVLAATRIEVPSKEEFP